MTLNLNRRQTMFQKIRITIATLCVSLLSLGNTPLASAQPDSIFAGTVLEKSRVMDVQEAQPILASLSSGQGWAFATIKKEANGDRFVSYQVVTAISAKLRVDSKTQVVFTLSEGTAWIPLRTIDVPAADGPAQKVKQSAQTWLQKNAEVFLLGDTGEAQRTTLPQLVKTIEPTLRQIEPPALGKAR
jgi:hypothetical protein